MPVTRRQKQRGIQDLELKLEVSRKLLSCMTDAELVEKVLPSKKNGDLTSKVVENLRRSWRHGHRPTKAEGMKFWDQLSFELICPEDVTGAMLVDVPIERFIGYLQQERQGLAREIIADFHTIDAQPDNPSKLLHTPNSTRTLDLVDSNLIWVRYSGPVETVAAGVRAGKVDQKHYYLDPDSANAWGRLVNADAYPTYDHCRTGLQALFESEPWKVSLDGSRPLTAVMLAGGGAPSKDLVLLRSLLAQPYVQTPIHYYLNDISPYMLTASAVWIRESLRSIGRLENVAVRLVYDDVFELAGLRELFHQQGKVIFAITGGTIGNFSEVAFFHSLNRAADDGDLLIVSADTLDGMPQHAVEDTLISKYNNPDLRNFIRPVVKAVLAEFNSHEPLDSALDRIKVTIRTGSYMRSSDVPHSRSVIVTLDVNGREIVLVTSTRYQSAELTAFAAGFGWQPVCQIPSPRNEHYQQFLFCRHKAERNGTPSGH
jgi:hypothetical protein